MQKIVCENVNFVWQTETIDIVVKLWESDYTFGAILDKVQRPMEDTLCLLLDLSLRGKIKKRSHYLTMYGDA